MTVSSVQTVLIIIIIIRISLFRKHNKLMTIHKVNPTVDTKHQISGELHKHASDRLTAVSN